MLSIHYEVTTKGAFVHVPSSLARDIEFHLRCKGVKCPEDRRIVADAGDSPDTEEITITDGADKVEAAIDEWFDRTGLEPHKFNDDDEITWEWEEQE